MALSQDQFGDTPPEILQLAHFSQEFNNESDRGAAMVAASRLDEVLSQVLLAFMADSTVSKGLLEGPNAPLGSLSSRIEMCFSLGLIEEREYRELNMIRKIRNEFGHRWRDVGFDSAPIADLCRALPWRGPEDIRERPPRGVFNFAVCMLLSDLVWRERLVRRERRTQKEWPYTLRCVGSGQHNE